MDIRNLLEQRALDSSQKPALIFEGQSLNFAQLRDACFALGNYLRQNGVKSLDKIAVFSPNTPAALVSMLAVLSVSATLVPLDFMLAEEEIVDFLNHSEAKVLFAHFRRDLKLSRLKRKCPHLEKIIVWNKKTDSFSPWQRLQENLPHKSLADSFSPNNLAAIFYTSGSTGHPKGVMLNYSHLNSPINCVQEVLDVSSHDILLCGGVPFSHIGGLDYVLLMLYFGQTLVLTARFKPLEFLRQLSIHKVTLFWIVPAMYVAILSLKGYQSFKLPALRYAVVFGAPSSPLLLQRFRRLCPHARLLNGWGMTETTAPNCVLPKDSDNLASIGRFYSGFKAKIVDETGKSLGPGQRGELWVKGEGVMVGYYKAEQLTKEVLTPDGWLKTGDIAYYDEKGFFYIDGRKKDMIKVGGEIVFASEVEEKLYHHPQIKEAAVVGVYDKLRGEVPKAFVVLQENASLEKNELREYLKNKLAHFKMPHYFEFVKELPKTRSGKIAKEKLKAEVLS